MVNMSMPYEGTFRKNTHFEEGVLIPPTMDSFFFRLSEKNLFYAETETDLFVNFINLGFRGILIKSYTESR